MFWCGSVEIKYCGKLDHRNSFLYLCGDIALSSVMHFLERGGLDAAAPSKVEGSGRILMLDGMEHARP